MYGGFQGGPQLGSHDAERPVSRTAISLIGDVFPVWLSFYTEKTIFPFPFTLNGIWSWWQFFFRFSEQNGIPFGSENRKENCHQDHIPFNVKGIGNIVFSVHHNVMLWCLISMFIFGDGRYLIVRSFRYLCLKLSVIKPGQYVY